MFFPLPTHPFLLQGQEYLLPSPAGYEEKRSDIGRKQSLWDELSHSFFPPELQRGCYSQELGGSCRDSPLPEGLCSASPSTSEHSGTQCGSWCLQTPTSGHHPHGNRGSKSARSKREILRERKGEEEIEGWGRTVSGKSIETFKIKRAGWTE